MPIPPTPSSTLLSPANAAQHAPALSKRRRGPGIVTPNACTECRKKRAKVRVSFFFSQRVFFFPELLRCASPLFFHPRTSIADLRARNLAPPIVRRPETLRQV